MNEQQLLRAIGAADPEHLEKSEQKAPKRRRRPWAGWAVAACLCLVVGAVFRLVLGGARGGPGNERAPAESTASDGAGTKASTFMCYKGPVLPLTLCEKAPELTAERAVTLDFAPSAPREVAYTDENGETRSYTEQDDAITVTDAYTLTNTSDRDVTVTALYPFVAAVRDLPDKTPELSVNGDPVAAELSFGAFCGGFSPVDRTGTAAQERWNLRYYHNWEDYRALLSDGSYQKSAFETLPELEQTVYVYTITPKGEPTQSPATVAFTPECDTERSRVLSYNFNGFDYDEKTGALQYSFFVCQEGMHVLAVLGEDFSGYTVQGYPDGGCDPAEALDTLSAVVTREEMTLCAFLKEILSDMPRQYYSESDQTPEQQELFYRAAVDFLLSYGALSDDPAERYDSWGGRLDDMFMDAYAVDRVCYAAFEVTVPAGECVTVTAALRKEASYDFYGTGTRNARTGVRGYDLATRLGSVLPLTHQTASIETRGLVEILEQNFGFEPENSVTTVTLDPAQEHYYLNVVRTETEP